jgi:hypothetical protein
MLLTKKIKMKKVFIIIGSLVFVTAGYAQVSVQDSVANEIFRINKVFDSSIYMGFNLSISYKSDSAGITKETDQMDGNYLLNRHNLYYNMGGAVYVQTDSFAYNIDPEEKSMIMTKNFIANNNEVFPLHSFTNAMIATYGSLYNITIHAIPVDSGEFVKRIRFERSNAVPSGTPGNIPVQDGAQYNYFYIDYTYGDETGFYHPIKFEFSYDEPAQSEITDSSGNTLTGNTYIATRVVAMNFSGFATMVNTDVFNDAKYVYYNRQRKIYEPAGAYRDYEFNTSGFDNEEENAEYFREVPPSRKN